DGRRSGVADGVEEPAPRADEDPPVPQGGRRLDAALEVDAPQLGRGDGRVGDVVGVQPALAVALDQRVVDDDGRLPGGRRELEGPADLARLPVDAADGAAVGGRAA